MPNLGREKGCRQRSPQDGTDRTVGALIDRDIDVRDAVNVEPIVFDVLYNPHDGHPRFGWVPSHANPPANRIAIGPIATSGGLIDDGDRLFAVFVAFGKKAATHELSLHDSKIIRTSPNDLG